MIPGKARAILFLLTTIVSSGEALAGANLWTSNGPADLGEIRALAYVPGTPPAILVQRWPSFAARSTDGGVTWSPMAGIPTGVSSEITSFVVAPSDPRIVFAVWHGAQATEREIYKSIDGGASWTAVGGGPAGPVNAWQTRRVAVAPSDATKVFAATLNGVYRSPDGGVTWLPSSNYVSVVYGIAVDPTNPLIVYQGRSSGSRVLKSLDGGDTWSPAATGLTSPVRDVAVDPANPLTVYAWATAGAFKSPDGGASWALAAAGLPPPPVMAPYYMYSSSIAFPPGAPSTVLALTSAGLYATTDGAATWAHIGPSAPPMTLLSFAGPLSDLYLGSYAGLQHSTDGGATFAPLPSITAGALVPTWEIHGDPLSTSTFFVRTRSGLFMTPDDGMTWIDRTSSMPAGTISSLFILPKAPNVWLLATSAGWYRSTDSGATWNPSGTGGGRLIADPFSPDVIYGIGSPGVVISTDQGQTWTTYATGLPDFGLQAVVPDATIPGVVFAAAGSPPDALYTSTDGGHSWGASASYPSDAYCGYVAVDPFDSQVVYALSGSYGGVGVADVFKSTDRGATWTPIVIPGVSGSYLNVIVADPLTPGKLYLATDHAGVWATTDAGTTWAPVNDGLPPGTSAQWFELHPGDPKKYLLASWDTGGGWSYVVNPTGSLLTGGGAFESSESLGSWTETGTAEVEFSSLSATPDGGGSAVVTAGGGASPQGARFAVRAAASGGGEGAEQACTPVDDRYTYALGAQILIPTGQAQTGSGRVVMSWYSDAACSAPLGTTETPPVSGAPFDVWRESVLAGVRPPAGSVRGQLGLFVTVDQPTGRFSANFDDVTFVATCDGASAVVSGGGTMEPGGSASVRAALAGLGPWTVTWSDGVVQTTPVSPLVRTVSPEYSRGYSITAVSDAYCSGPSSGVAFVEVQRTTGPIPALGGAGLAALALVLGLLAVSALCRAR